MQITQHLLQDMNVVMSHTHSLENSSVGSPKWFIVVFHCNSDEWSKDFESKFCGVTIFKSSLHRASLDKHYNYISFMSSPNTCLPR